MNVKTPRGYSLNLVLMLSTVLVVSMGAMLVVLAHSAQLSGDNLARKQTFFATDGMMRAAMKVANDYLSAHPGATSSEVNTNAFTTAVLDSITPSGYTRESFSFANSTSSSGPVPNGAFAGMNAQLFPTQASVKLRRTLHETASREQQSSTIAHIAMFEFMVFSSGYMDWEPGPRQEVNGRVHSNGDICLQGGADFCLSRVSSAGGIYNMRDGTNCRENHTGSGHVWISRTATPNFATCSGISVPSNADWALLDTTPTNREHGCTSCSGISGAVWSSWAQTEFNGNAMDKDMGVNALQLPVSGTPSVQAGLDANKGTRVNTAMQRLLVDPVRSGDAQDIIDQKYAAKADIRIIDGVWYLAESGVDWPGTPIWSDHPGSYTISAAVSPDEQALVGNKAVGQDDIRTALASRGVTWATTPRRFSYFEVDQTAHKMMDKTATSTGIVSYGSIAGTGTSDRWGPAFYTGSNQLCDSGTASSSFKYALPSAGEVGCSSGGKVPYDVALLAATRSGFRDGHVQAFAASFAGGANGGSVTSSAAQRNATQKILPTNFDMAAFRAALADGTAGELGSFFCATGGSCLMHRPFNGIVWITSTWKDSLLGFPNGFAKLHTAQGGQAGTVTQPSPQGASGGGADGSGSSQSALPYELCSTSIATQVFSTTTGSGGGGFKAPNCTDYNNGGGARPNSVRVINADVFGMDYTGDGATDGFSVVSSLPVYVVGPVNTLTSSGAAINTSSDVATPWNPAMVGGDQVYLLSKVWTDANLPWDKAVSAPGGDDTTYNIEILAGWSESAGGQYSGGVENFPRFLENLGGKDNVIVGSMVIGFDSVYFRWPRAGSGVYGAPDRKWSFDTHLNAIANQPPGTPRYNVYATKQWTRQ